MNALVTERIQGWKLTTSTGTAARWVVTDNRSSGWKIMALDRILRQIMRLISPVVVKHLF